MPQFPNPSINPELMYEQAHVYAHDAIKDQPIGTPPPEAVLRNTGLMTDIAVFGYLEDVERVSSLAQEMTVQMEGRHRPLQETEIGIVEKHAEAAGIVGGEYLDTVKHLFDVAQFSEGSTPPQHRILAALAKSGRPDILKDALQAVLQAPYVEEQVESLQDYKNIPDFDAGRQIVSITKDMGADTALSYLLDNPDTTMLAEAEERFKELKIGDRDKEDEFDEFSGEVIVDKYLSRLADLYKLTKKDEYRDAFAYYLDEMPDEPEKLDILTFHADALDSAPQRYAELHKKLYPDFPRNTGYRATMARMYATQQQFEKAMQQVEGIDVSSAAGRKSYSHGMDMILAAGGVHYVDRIIDGMAANMQGYGAPAGKALRLEHFDSDMQRAADRLIRGNFLADALKVVPHLQAPANKVRLLRDVYVASLVK